MPYKKGTQTLCKGSWWIHLWNPNWAWAHLPHHIPSPRASGWAKAFLVPPVGNPAFQHTRFHVENIENTIGMCFPTVIRPPPLYILEDHGWLKDPTLNCLFYINYPTFIFFQLFRYSLHLSARSTAFLGCLVDPRTTLSVLLPSRSSWVVFSGFCAKGRTLGWPNRSLHRFSRSLELLVASD